MIPADVDGVPLYLHRVFVYQTRGAHFCHYREKGYRIVFFSGFELRNCFNSDTPIIFNPRDTALVSMSDCASDEIWVDRDFCTNGEELAWLLWVDFIESECRRQGLSYDDTTAYILAHCVAKTLCPPYIVWAHHHDGVIVHGVKGDVVQRWQNPLFVLGGHGLVYPWHIAPHVVIVDARASPSEQAAFIVHEYAEYQAMRRGDSYDIAHRCNGKPAEDRYRMQHCGAQYPGDNTYRSIDPRSLIRDPKRVRRYYRPASWPLS